MRLVVVDGDPRRPRAAQVIAREGLKRIYRRLVIGAFNAQRDALAGLKQTRRGDDGKFKLVNRSRLQLLSRLMGLDRLPRRDRPGEVRGSGVQLSHLRVGGVEPGEAS